MLLRMVEGAEVARGAAVWTDADEGCEVFVLEGLSIVVPLPFSSPSASSFSSSSSAACSSSRRLMGSLGSRSPNDDR